MTAIATTPHPVTKTCPGCGDEKPIHQFRRRSRKTGARASRCNNCFAKSTRLQRALKGERDIATFQRLIRETQNIHRVGMLLKAIMKRFGGVEKFADEWKRQIDTTSKLRPGSKRVLDAYEAISHLTRLHSEAVDESDGSPVDLSDVSDEELDRILQKASEGVILAL